MHPRELLLDTTPFIAPAQGLDGLAPDDADRRLPGAPHTIAEIVAHLAFWQDWFLDRARGTGTVMPASAGLGWAAPPPGSWGSGRQAFLDGLERLAAFAATADPARAVDPPIEFPPIARYTVADVVAHVATHNAHHLGQVVLLRQLMGRWPPPAGSWTW
jgi:uncharacterized damage-inducible protein DinB